MTKPVLPTNAPSNSPSRRQFLRHGSAAAAALSAASLLLNGCGSSTGSAIATNAHAAAVGDGPEVSKVKFGMIALTDCSPIVIAHEKGLFQKHGIQSAIIKPANWAAVRDSLVKGDIQATHMLLGMPIAASLGLGGQTHKMVVPWILNRNGQAITLKNDWKGKVAADPAAIKPFADEAKAAGKKLTFAMTFPPGTHAMWLRYYLAAGGIHPDTDVELITIPPPQMVANMKVGKMDGFCVGEPWNARTILDGIGYTSVSTQQIWRDHPEKVCGMMADFADKNPKTVKAILKALHEASVWLDDLKNRPEQCDIVSREKYINCHKDVIQGRLLGEYDYGDGRKEQDSHPMIFSQRNCNYPQPAYCRWWLTQLRRWGMVTGKPNYDGVTKQVMRPDLYTEAMKEIDYQHGGEDNSPWTMFDQVAFDPAGDCEAYATGFAVRNLKE